ncbi:MAG: hypothetical protein C0425_11365 [Chlorobiaceae bacterium]|nr:hypothetical protein [Chlorobiaceae bacterium]
MKVLSVLVVLFITSTVFPQEKLFQAEVGLNRSWFDFKITDLNEIKTEFRPQITAGLYYKFASFDNFSFKAGLRYYNLSRYIDMSPFGYGNGSLATFDNYLVSVPLQINYNIDFINTYAFLNVEPSYVLSSKTKLPSFSTAFGLESRDVTKEMNRFQFAVGVGLEYVVNILQQKFGIKTIYNYGLTPVPKKGEFTNSSRTYEWVEFKTSELNLLITYYF